MRINTERVSRGFHDRRQIIFRKIIQTLALLGSNAYIAGFVSGRIYRGRLKTVCFPGLNCYSCPGAVASCPLGSLQAVLGTSEYRFSFYVTGLVVGFGVLLGRFVCGFLCPFGLLFDLLYRIPFVKKIRSFPGDKLLRYLKYALLLVFVLLLPAFFMDAPAYCKFICPQGMLQGGVFLLLLNRALWPLIGILYAWKLGILIVVLLLSLVLYRPFCKYLCPLGAIYGLCNPVSLLRLRLDATKCISCGACSHCCHMGVNPQKTQGHPECIRCGECVKACPRGALKTAIGNK